MPNVSQHIAITIRTAGAAPRRAGFGVPLGLFTFAGSNRQYGPYTSPAAMVSDSALNAAARLWGAAVFRQQPSVRSVMIGRRDSADADVSSALDAVELAGPGTHYAINLGTRTVADILLAAAWTESRRKILVAQSASAAFLAGTESFHTQTLTFGGTATNGFYSAVIAGVEVEIERAAGTPATNTDLATAYAAAVEAETDLDAVVSATSAGAVVTITSLVENAYVSITEVTAPAPGTLVLAETVAVNPGLALQVGQYNRTALSYHVADAEYLDGSITGRCLAMDPDARNGMGVWAYKQVAGLATADNLTDAQAAAILAASGNYYALASSPSGVDMARFFWPGTMASGRYIDITITNDWTEARMQEAILGAFLATPTKIDFDDGGLQYLRGIALGVLSRGCDNGHFARDAVSSESGRVTPWVDVPQVVEFSSAEKQARGITMNAEVVYAGAIQTVNNLTIDMSFG